jgi:hypothetical protein
VLVYDDVWVYVGENVIVTLAEVVLVTVGVALGVGVLV